MASQSNSRVFLKSRPGVDGYPSEDNFGFETVPYPGFVERTGTPLVLLKTLYLSVDPVQRYLMNEVDLVGAVDDLKSFGIGGTIYGAGLGVVVRVSSQVKGLKAGDLVTSGTRLLSWPWQLYFTCNVADVEPVDVSLVGTRPTLVLSCLGLIGLTSLIGIREKGCIVRGVDKTFVVSGAAGACGSLAGQIARLDGVEKVIGICGTDKKCRFLQEELGFDVAINYKSEDVRKRLQDSCPHGVDVYFDNVGGQISNDVIELMNVGSRIVLCGQISQYNKNVPYPPPIPDNIANLIKTKNIERDLFALPNYPEKFQDGLKKLSTMLHDGKLKVKESFEEGLENAPRAFIKMMRGENVGKQLVHVADV